MSNDIDDNKELRNDQFFKICQVCCFFLYISNAVYELDNMRDMYLKEETTVNSTFLNLFSLRQY